MITGDPSETVAQGVSTADGVSVIDLATAPDGSVQIRSADDTQGAILLELRKIRRLLEQLMGTEMKEKDAD